MSANFKDKLKNFIEEQIKIDEFSGVVLVAKNDEIILKYVCGFANKEKKIPNKIDTKFNLGSANKMFTGVAIAQLAQKGLLSFQDTVGKYLPDYLNRDVVEKVTIHHLLTHTSGLGHYLSPSYLRNATGITSSRLISIKSGYSKKGINEKYMKERDNLKTIDDFIKLFVDEPLLFNPGEKVSYSGNAYTLLGKIIEVISGQTYYDYVRENIFQKANMPNTDSFEIDPNNLRPDIAVGYTRRTDIEGHIIDGER